VLTERTERGRQRGGGKDNPDSRAAASNGKERRESAQRTETKKERGEHTDIRHTILSSDPEEGDLEYKWRSYH
jgi:hypothetical protein